jgi:hypothetical protein
VKTRTLTIGLVVLVIGIALAAVGEYSLKSATMSITSFTQPTAGEYVSSELVLNDSVVVVRSPASVGGMVPTQDISTVNSTNIDSYAVADNSSAASSDTYIGLRGDYNYVVFSSVQPTTKIVVTGAFSRTVSSGLLVLAGAACVFAGVIVTLVGALRKNRAKKVTNSDDDYYAKRDSTTRASR